MASSDLRPIDFRIFRDINLVETHYNAGAEILGPGKSSGLMFVVKRGYVQVQLAGVVVEEVRDGGIFGELGMVDPRPHTAQVIAVTDVDVFVVNESQFVQLVANTPAFALRVMKVIARRIRAMNDRLREGRDPDAVTAA